MTLNNLDIKVSGFLQHLTYNFQWIGSSMRFFKNASKTKYKRSKKKSHAPSWEGAPKKRASIHPRKKWRRSREKEQNLLISDAPEM